MKTTHKGTNAIAERYRPNAGAVRPIVIGVRGLNADGETTTPQIRRGFHDVMIAYPVSGPPVVVRASTMPWQRSDGDRHAEPLPPGRYRAEPHCSDKAGHLVSKGAPMFVLVDDETGEPVISRAGWYSLYHESVMSPHVGCQVIPDDAWEKFKTAIGGEKKSFPYVLVERGTADER